MVSHFMVWLEVQGLGITMFGIAYMFVHDGLVHRRFPVGPIADVPYFQKVAAAHQVDHCVIVYMNAFLCFGHGVVFGSLSVRPQTL
jgi:hypothetical protein